MSGYFIATGVYLLGAAYVAADISEEAPWRRWRWRTWAFIVGWAPIFVGAMVYLTCLDLYSKLSGRAA